MRFAETTSDHCIYIAKGGEPFIIGIYVDDILQAGKNDKQISEVKLALAERFDVKDLGELNYFLGVKIVQNHRAGTIWIGQLTYTEEVTQSAVGSLLYLSMRTRLDITFAVTLATCFCSKPTSQHLTAVKRIFRYLRETTHYGLLFKRNGSKAIVGYSDADWGGDTLDCKSTTGYLFQIGGTAITWQSKKQSCFALSTAEAEYVALSGAAQEAVWLKQFNQDLTSINDPVVIYENNQSAIAIAKNPQFHRRAKHINIEYHFIREQVNNNNIK